MEEVKVQEMPKTIKTDSEILDCYFNPIKWGEEVTQPLDNTPNGSDFDKRSMLSSLPALQNFGKKDKQRSD